MPAPQYIICCQNVTQDAQTGLIDHFHVIESLRPVSDATAEQNNVAPIRSLVVTTVWRRLPIDPIEQEYESINEMVTPEGESRQTSSKTFTFQPESQTIRFILHLTPIPMMEPGQFVIKSKIRPVGSQEWITQEYVIDIHEEKTAARETNPPAA